MRNLYVLIIWAVILGSWNFDVSAQNVNFPDANLAAEVREELGLNAGDDIPLTSLQGLTRLDARSAGITDLTGLEEATALIFLYLYDNQISDITLLGSLTNLTDLSLGDNPIRDFTILSTMTSLKFLSLSRTKFSDFTILLPLTQIYALFLNENGISDLTGFPGLPNIQGLHLQDNQISDLTPLENLTNPTSLQNLVLSNNRISDLTPLGRFTGLTQLYLDGNQISDLTPLGLLINIEWRLHIRDNQISDISPLRTLTKLIRLYFEKNQVSDLSPLEDLTNLITLEICYNPYTDISPIATLVNLRTLEIDEAFVEANEALVGATTGARLILCPPLPTSGGGGGGGGGGGRAISKLSVPGQIGFSELMFVFGGGLDSLPQWIELCNASETETVNLWGWHLEIEARDANGEHQHTLITFKDLLIPPNQTALIVTSEAPNSVDLPKERIYNFSTHHPNAFKDNEEPNKVLGLRGIFLKLSDPDGAVSDVAGNLDGDSKTEDEPAWELPSGMTANAARTSLFRHYDPAKGTPLDGEISENWVRAADVQLEYMTYWGKYTDIGNPGRKGGWKFPFGRMSFSELMFTSRGGLHSLPQWIELYNTTETEVDLRGWHLKIETRDANDEHRYAVITLDGFIILPHQTALMVTSNARSSSVLSSFKFGV